MAEDVKKKYDHVIHTLSDLIMATLYKQGKVEEAQRYSLIMKEQYEEEMKEREEARKRCEEELKVYY